MAMSERERYEFYVFIEETFGKHGEAFMNMLAPDLPLRMDHLSSELRGEMSMLRSELRGEMSALGSELRGEMSSLRSEMRTEMSSLRSDVTSQLAGILPRLVVANLLAMLAVAGLVLAAVAIA